MVAPQKSGEIGTQEITIDYRNKKRVPFLRLIDSRGIELTEGYSADKIGLFITNCIKEELSKNDANNFVHCIWHCVNTASDRFQKKEPELVREFIKAVKNIEIPVIIVLTKADNIESTEKMKNYIKEQGFNDVVEVLAKRNRNRNGISEPFGLDNLLTLTFKKCREGFNGNMNKVMMKNLKQYIKMKLFKKNENTRSLIIQVMKSDIVKKYLENQNFVGYIRDLYYYHICYFLDKNDLSSKSSSLIKYSEFNRHKNNFFEFCKENENKLISNILPHFANKFLDIQATKEKVKRQSVQIINNRNYEDFIKTSSIFLLDNFNYFATKYYIYFIISYICGKLSANFELELNKIVESLLLNNEILRSIEDCFNKKLSDFEQNAKRYPPFINNVSNYNNFNMPFNETED